MNDIENRNDTAAHQLTDTELDAISAGRRQDGNDLLIANNGDGSDFLERRPSGTEPVVTVEYLVL